jgi:hypothetical protein
MIVNNHNTNFLKLPVFVSIILIDRFVPKYTINIYFKIPKLLNIQKLILVPQSYKDIIFIIIHEKINV